MVACGCAAVFAQPAAAFERVTDGGFDAATCTSTGCTSTVWTQTKGPAMVGPICSGANLDCYPWGSGYTTPSNWATLGRGTGVSNTSAVQQTIQIPAAPATLKFNLWLDNPHGTGHGTFTVTIDGTAVFTATETTTGFATYTQKVLDVSSFAGGTRVLRFQGTTTGSTSPSDFFFDLDNVSVDAPEAVPDADHDGFIGTAFGGPDCNDANPAIHPGAIDIPHNGIDEDCSGADAPYPALPSKSKMAVLFFKGYTRVTKLDVSGAPAGATIVLSCSSRKRGCPFTSKTIAATGAPTLRLAKRVRNARFKNNATVTVRVTKTGFIGTYEKFTVRIRKLPKQQTLCLEPGAAKPQATCS